MRQFVSTDFLGYPASTLAVVEALMSDGVQCQGNAAFISPWHLVTKTSCVLRQYPPQRPLGNLTAEQLPRRITIYSPAAYRRGLPAVHEARLVYFDDPFGGPSAVLDSIIEIQADLGRHVGYLGRPRKDGTYAPGHNPDRVIDAELGRLPCNPQRLRHAPRLGTGQHPLGTLIAEAEQKWRAARAARTVPPGHWDRWTAGARDAGTDHPEFPVCLAFLRPGPSVGNLRAQMSACGVESIEAVSHYHKERPESLFHAFLNSTCKGEPGMSGSPILAFDRASETFAALAVLTHAWGDGSLTLYSDYESLGEPPDSLRLSPVAMSEDKAVASRAPTRGGPATRRCRSSRRPTR